MKRNVISILILLTLFFNLFAQAVFAESDAANWYIKRAGNSQPKISDEQRIIEKYNGIYIDKGLGDESEEKRIYLTFDAGYENGNVEKILNVLKENEVSAAFFVLDHIILNNTDLIKRMAEEGHLVCNHTKNHKDLTKLSREEIIKNLSDLEKIYEEKTGLKMAKFFRFPEGRYNEASLRVVNEIGYKTVFWSFGYEDWDNARQMQPEKAMSKILDNTHNGEIILLHPNSATNAKILPDLIKAWRERGYTFGSLSEIK